MKNVSFLNDFDLIVGRFLESICVAYYLFTFLFRFVIFVPILVYIWFTKFYFVTVLYIGWYIYDFQTPFRGGRRSDWYRNLPMSDLACRYFSPKLIKTADLSSNKNYIFGCHPHGVAAVSHIVAFGGKGMSEQFPNLDITPVTLQCYFWLPMQREIIMAAGACPSTRESINYILGKKKNGGKGVAIVVGGANEMSITEPGKMRLILKNRKGFVRLALQNGASLVPVISFGENELFPYKPMPDWKPWRKLPMPIQEFLRMVRFLYHFLFRCKQLIPDRKPLTIVVGKPIEVNDVNGEPTEEEIDHFHRIYIDELRKLYEDHRDKYGYRGVPLEIL